MKYLQFINTIIFRIFSYSIYLMKAQTNHYIHSPFVFSFINKVKEVNQRSNQHIKRYRQHLIKDLNPFYYIDKNGNQVMTTISKRYQQTSINDKYGNILSATAMQIEAINFLELGTSLGVSTSYLYTSIPNIKGHTVDMDTSASKIANDLFHQYFPKSNLNFHISKFDEIIESLLLQLNPLSLCFVDGDHTYESTVRYVKLMIPYMANHSAIILDDIRWNRSMYKAWEEVRLFPEFNYTIDYGRIGILFKIENQSNKQNFILF